ncbi:MAG: DoxX family protein [Flavobacteriales bacterium]
MKRLLTLQGILGILFLAAAAVFLILPYKSETVVDEFNIYWMFTYSALGLGFLIVIHESGLSIATLIARIFTGSLFIVSGLIKANDPKGFGYKLEEYFREDSLGSFWSSFHDFAIPLAIVIATAEVVLGLAVLFGGKARLANWTLFGMAVFFAWLTWYTASCNDNHAAFQSDKAARMKTVEAKCGEWWEHKDEIPDESYLPEEVEGISSCKAKFLEVDTLSFGRECVNDCGCFGDALKGSIGRSLTPWESFYKDITLMFYILVLLVQQKKIKLNTLKDDAMVLPASLLAIALFAGGLFSWWFPFWFTLIGIIIYILLKRYYLGKIGQDWTIAIAMIIYSFAFTFYCYTYLPIKDFRPYQIGNDIMVEKTDIAPVLKFEYKFKVLATGEEVWLDVFPENYEATHEYLDNRTMVVDPGRNAPARDFSMSLIETGEDITDSVLKLENVFFLVCYDLTKASPAKLKAMNTFAQAAMAEGRYFYLLTSTLPDRVNTIQQSESLNFTACLSDEKVLKTMIRSNPGLMYLKRGVVTDMWPGTALPDYESFKSKIYNENR